MNTMLRWVTGLAIALLIGTSAGAAENAALARKVSFEIYAQPMLAALVKFSEQSGIQLAFPTEDAAGLNAPAVVGELTPTAALDRLLQGSGLRYELANDGRIVTIRPVAAEGKSTASSTQTAAARLAQYEPVSAGGNGSWRLARAQAAQEKTGASVQQSEEQNKQGSVQEIIVTATKRAENIQDVPLSIAVVSSEDIERRGLVSAEDYLRGIPGVNQGSTITGSSVIIRGLETSPSFQNFSSGPTTATYFGETPTTNSGGLLNNGSVDIKLVDIERVEVLRGPQGTAFGDSSLGGAVRTIPVAPKTDRFEGKVVANYSATSGYGSGNYMVQGIGNIPLIKDKLAIRAVAYQYSDSGYYRNTAGSDAAFQASVAAVDPSVLPFAVNVKEIGSSVFTGGRLSALWQASKDLKLTVSYLTQKTEVDGLPLTNRAGDHYAQAGLQLPPEHIVRGQKNGISDTDIDLANATLEYDLGWGDLVGTLSHVKSGSDVTRPYSLFTGFFYAQPMSQHALSDHKETVGEIRLATKFQGPVNFLAGLFAQDLDDTTAFPFVWYGIPSTNPFGGGRYPGDQRDYTDERNLKQKAAFAEVSWEFLPGLTLTGGARAYKYDRTVHVETHGAVYGEQTTTDKTEESDSTFRGTLSYKPTDAAMVYASWGEGFRLGKPQPGVPAGVCDINPPDGLVDGSSTTIASTRSVDSDTVESTELGGKFSLLDRRVMLSAALFRVKWTGMPFLTAAPSPPDGCGLNYITNAGAARSEGVESQITLRVAEGLSIDAGGSYIDAKLTEDVPTQNLPSGARLPGSPKWNANFGIQYAFGLRGYESYVRADSIYIGTFSSVMPYAVTAESGGYVKLDVSAGMAINNFNVELFVRNLTDVDDFTFNDTISAYSLRPRTVGIQLGYDFR